MCKAQRKFGRWGEQLEGSVRCIPIFKTDSWRASQCSYHTHKHTDTQTHTDTHTHRQTHTHTHTQTRQHTQTDTHTYRHTHRQTRRHANTHTLLTASFTLLPKRHVFDAPYSWMLRMGYSTWTAVPFKFISSHSVCKVCPCLSAYLSVYHCGLSLSLPLRNCTR